MKTRRKTVRIQALIVGLVVSLLMAGCAGKKADVTPKPATMPVVQKSITNINVMENDDAVNVVIAGNQTLTYTSVRQPFPAGVVLYFPDTEASQIAPQIKTGTDVVGPITISELTESGHTTRVEIGLSQDASYEVTRQGDGLVVAVNKPAQTAEMTEETLQESAPKNPEPVKQPVQQEAAAASVPVVPATQLVDVETDAAGNGMLVNIKADGIIRDFNAFTLDNPARIVLDIFNVRSPFTGQQKINVGNEWVSRIRHFGNEEKLRVVLETKPDYLGAYNAVPVAGGLTVALGDATPPPAGSQQPAVHGELAATGQMSAASGGTPAFVNRIDFASEDNGKSSLSIGLTMPAEYQVDQIGDAKLLLTLINTELPDYRQKPLITTRFESAVDRIVPYKTDEQPNNALFTIELREMVPYQLEQSGDALVMHFDASTVPPRMLSEANLAPWQQALNEAMAIVPPEGALTGGDVDLDAPVTVQPQNYIEDMNKPKEYTGEKIALDFYDTDIKNVFRILREVSGQNFAIDKDVTGRVTLTLEKPVPWDQVLDLILRMNGLGMVNEGNIIRIATLESIKAEEDARQQLFSAAKEAQKQEEELAPLVTEFINVSYADINDIDAKVKLLLTEGRGTSSVHQGTNQVIITDTEQVIAKAKALIDELDKPTPQVMIEARIVEASTTLVHSLGISWAASGKVTTSASGSSMGDGDYLMATNSLFDVFPTEDAADLLFNLTFSKIPGTFFDVVTAKLDALETSSDGKVISSPKVLTLDHTAATITQGDEVPYITRDEAGNPTTEFKPIELKLAVTPHVTTDNRIKMEIEVNNDVLKIFDAGTGSATSNVQTTLLVNDGDTVVIGGILKSEKNHSYTGIPGLSKIPIIGYLFQTNSDTINKKELLVFITPRIVQLEQMENM